MNNKMKSYNQQRLDYIIKKFEEQSKSLENEEQLEEQKRITKELLEAQCLSENISIAIFNEYIGQIDSVKLQDVKAIQAAQIKTDNRQHEMRKNVVKISEKSTLSMKDLEMYLANADSYKNINENDSGKDEMYKAHTEEMEKQYSEKELEQK